MSAALTGLAPGLHGFHVHEKPSCDAATRDGVAVAALAAGGHLDPAGTRASLSTMASSVSPLRVPMFSAA